MQFSALLKLEKAEESTQEGEGGGQDIRRNGIGGTYAYYGER